ncbi:glutathione hydrolase 1 proenzyme-like [Gigantopelta aegis]|uniref:glutathione hydrolase 1 proenzyme-like n=1 Tax=Gigantopelta aegis TaxID=1735272 RepID=UPI001B8898FF|nr:glutathione hydrolase 1 proenzyme-like [Gigantopelta aegis]
MYRSEKDPIIFSPDENIDTRLKRKRRCRLYLSIALMVLLLVCFVVLMFCLFQEVDDDDDDSLSKWGKYCHAAVASDVPQCSDIGKSILQKNGNAVDSAIATLLCMGLADAHHMGIGGGFFMTIYNRTTGKSVIIDARETAPLAADKNMFQNVSSDIGGLSIAVPGEIKGYWAAHQEFGSLPWRDLFLPAISMVQKGFKVPNKLAVALDESRDWIMKDKSMREAYVNKKTGDVYKEGEIRRDPKLAKTLQIIADEGMQAFYNGSLTDDILSDINERDSIITKADLLQYVAERKDPLTSTLHDNLTIFTPPLPSSGALLIFMLNVLDGYRFTHESVKHTRNAILTYHRIVETFKFAYALRMDLGDEPLPKLIANLTSHKFADEIRSKIWDNQTHNLAYYGKTSYSEIKTSTAHLSIIDQGGNAVSVTSTINLWFGSRVRGIRTGILFNDEMDDFSSPNKTNSFGIPPSPANFIKPGKRPLSSMCPSVFVDKHGDVKLVVGAAGGSHITTATALVSSDVLWFGKNIEHAIDMKRIHHQLLPPYIEYESGFNQKVIEGLVEKGHNVTSKVSVSSVVQGVVRKGKYLYACSDYRNAGAPAGF